MSYRPTLNDMNLKKSNVEPISRNQYRPKLEDIPVEEERNPFDVFKMNQNQEQQFRNLMQNTYKDLVTGAVQGIANIPSGTAALITGKQIPRFNFAPESEASQLGQAVPPFLAPNAIGLGIGKALPYIPKAVEALNKLKSVGKGNVVTNALMSAPKPAAEIGYINALEHPENAREEFLTGAEIGGTLGAALPLIGTQSSFLPVLGKGAIGAGIGAQFGHPYSGAALAAGLPVKALLNLESDTDIAKNMLNGLNQKDVQNAINAARRLGVTITPAEASGNYPLSAREGALKRSVGGAQKGYEHELQQKTGERKVINKMLGKIYNPTPANQKAIDDAYKAAYHEQYNIDPAIINAMMQNSTFKEAVDTTMSIPGFADLPLNNYEFLHQVDRTLGNMAKSTDTTLRYKYGAYKKMFSNFLKENNPEFEKAQALAQPRIVRENIESKLNKNEEDLTAKNFYSKLLNSRANYKDVLRQTANFPEAQAMIKDMRVAWKNISNMKTVSQSEAQAKVNIDNIRNAIDSVMNRLNNLALSKSNAKKLNFIYSDKWEKQFDELQRIQSQKERIEKTASFMINTLVKAGLTNDQARNFMKVIAGEE